MSSRKTDQTGKKRMAEKSDARAIDNKDAPTKDNLDLFNEILAFVFITFLLVIPFIFSTHTKSNFIVPKMGIFGMTAAALFAVYLLGITLFGRIKITRTIIYIPLGAFIIAELLSLINTPYMHGSLVEFWARFSGALAAILALNLITTRLRLVVLVRGLAFSGFVNAIVGIIQQSKITAEIDLKGPLGSLFSVTEPVMIMGNTNYSAGFMVFTIFMAAGLVIYEQEKALKGLWINSILVMCIGLFFTDCQGAYLGVLVGITAFIGGLVYAKRKLDIDGTVILKAIAILVTSSAIILAASWGMARSGNKSLKDYLKPGARAYTGRLIMWQATWIMIKNHPLVGNGVGSYQANYLPSLTAYLETVDPFRFLNQIQNAEKAHNQYIQVWAEEGLLGLLAILALMAYGHIKAFKDLTRIESSRDRGLLLGITAGLIGFEALLFVSSLLVITPLREYFFILTALQWVAGRIALNDIEIHDIDLAKSTGVATEMLVRTGLFAAGLALIAGGWFLGANVLRANILKNNAKLFTELGKYKAAIAVYGMAQKITPGDAKIDFYKGSVLLLQGKTMEGYEKLKLASVQYPDVNLYTNLGKVSMDLQLRDEAIGWYKKAADTYLKVDFTHGALAANLAKSGRYKEALEVLDRMLKVYPNDMKLVSIKALAYMNTGRMDEALQLYKKVLSVNPKDNEALNNMGVIQINFGKYPEAEKTLRRLLALKPRHVNALNNLASALYKQGRFDQAKRKWLTILKIDPKNAVAKKNLRQLFQPATNPEVP